MKRTLLLLLALILLVSLNGVALAAGVDATDEATIGTQSGTGADAITTIFEEEYSNWDGTAADTSSDDKFIYDSVEGQAAQNTDIWVRSKAAGQIDATVPLLVVVSTDIDGLETQTPSNYVIRNYSTVALQLDEIYVAPQTGWTLLSQPATATRDVMNTGATAANNNIAITVAGVNAANNVVGGGAPVDISGTTKFAIAANDVGAAGKTTDLGLAVATSKLNFVTYADDTDTENLNKGVFAVKITYTLSIAAEPATGLNDIAADPIVP